MEIQLSEKNKKDLLLLVREVIATRLNINSGVDNASMDFSGSVFREKYGAFVTLHIQGHLRGCIGYIKAMLPLVDTIREMAVSAAFKDPRFPPLSVQEFKRIDIEISVLSPIEPLKSIEDIVIGRDGLIVKKGWQSGLLLPQVATEYNWNVEQFLDHTCMKAGLHPGEWKDRSAVLQYFSAFVFGEKEMGLLTQDDSGNHI